MFSTLTERMIAGLALAGVVGCPAESSAQDGVATDRAALVTLYDATGGPQWERNTNWNTGALLREWYGVRTDAAGRVTRLELVHNYLTETIPRQLGDIANLAYLALAHNALTGPIPPALGNLVNLESLRLQGNALTGPIPTTLGELVNLAYLSLRGNALTGPIPASVGNLTNRGCPAGS